MTDDLHDAFSAICRKNGWKNTPQRFAIFKAVHENLNHPSVDSVQEEVHKTMPSVSRESVYRILNEFAEKGILVRLDELNSARYDWQTEPHGHFICVRCGTIHDFPLSVSGIPTPDEMGCTSFQHVELRLSGVCKACRKKEKQNRQKPGKQ